MSVLSRIDDFFSNRSKKDFGYMILLIFILFSFIIFYYIFPIVKKFENQAYINYQTKLKSLNNSKIQLRVYRIEFLKSQNRLKELKNQFLSLKKQKVFYQELSNLLDFAQFNKYKWAVFVKNLIDDAKNEGLKVKLLKNDANETSDELIAKKISLDIDLIGNYKNFIYFLYTYESRKDLLRIEKINIKSPTHQYIKINLYGIGNVK